MLKEDLTEFPRWLKPEREPLEEEPLLEELLEPELKEEPQDCELEQPLDVLRQVEQPPVEELTEHLQQKHKELMPLTHPKE